MRTALDVCKVGIALKELTVVLLLLSSCDDSRIREINGLAHSEFDFTGSELLGIKPDAGVDASVGIPATKVVEVIDASAVKFVLHFKVGNGAIFATEEASLEHGAEKSIPTRGYLGTLTEDEEVRFGRFVRYSLKLRSTITGKVVFSGSTRKDPLDSIEELRDGCVVAIINRGKQIEVTIAQGPEKGRVHSFNCGGYHCVAAKKLPGRNAVVVLIRKRSVSSASADLVLWDYSINSRRVVASYKAVQAVLE